MDAGVLLETVGQTGPWRGLQAAASRLVSMPGAENRSSVGKSVETSLDAADTSVRATQASVITRLT